MSVSHTELDTKPEFCLYLLSIRARRGDLFSAIRFASEGEKIANLAKDMQWVLMALPVKGFAASLS